MARPHIITANGNSQVDTAQKKFGTGSLLNTQVGGDFISTPDDTDFNFGSGPFTLECFIRFSNTSGNHGIISHYVTASIAWDVSYSGDVLNFNYSTDGIGVTAIPHAWTPSADTWYHIVIEREADNLRCFVDGTEVGGGTSVAGVTIFNSTATVNIGGIVLVREALNGWIDEIRVSNVARYSGNFTPTTSAFSSDASTVYLVHCDGADASTAFTDDNSGTPVASASSPGYYGKNGWW